MFRLAPAASVCHRLLRIQQLPHRCLRTSPLFTDSPHNNVTETVAKHVGRGLLNQENHPLSILKNQIYQYFDTAFVLPTGKAAFQKFDDLHPVVTVQACFDDLLIPPDHVSRSPSDTFYTDEAHCLRAHTSAHQTTFLRQGISSFLVAGDVYRKDEIDSSHYPVFHQMEGVHIFDAGQSQDDAEIERHLKHTLEGLVRTLFGDTEMRWNPDYFPFTDPSFELEVMFEGEWLEVLGCGVVHPEIMKACGLAHRKGWAFGLGLERLAMILFTIPDIRLFWTTDPRFHEQFQEGTIKKFKPYSKYPACYKDIAFWLPEGYNQNEFYSVVLDSAEQDMVEKVDLIDSYVDPATSRQSHCYRIMYRSMDRNLTNEEVDEIQELVRNNVQDRLGCELR